jgi:hypothetical protein
LTPGENLSKTTIINGKFNDFASKSACSWFLEEHLLKKWEKVAGWEISRNWFNLFLFDFYGILSIHNKRSDYLVPGLSLVADPPPFLHTNIEQTNPWVSVSNSDIYELARLPGRAWNYLSAFTAYAGFWWTIILVYAFFDTKSRQVLVLASILNFSVYISAVIPDARYVAFTVISGYAFLLAFILRTFCFLRNSIGHSR